MTPHQANDDQPWDDSQGNGEPTGSFNEEILHEGSDSQEGGVVGHEEIPYDPGAALVDENQTYAVDETVYYDPTQAYQDPSQVYHDPSQAYQDPSQVYHDPTQAYQDPSQAYQDPSQVYHDPSQVYHDPTQAYHDPTQAYHDPTQAYHDPGLAYEEPSQAYYGGVPAESLGEGYGEGYVTESAAGHELPQSSSGSGVYDDLPNEVPEPVPLAPRRAAKKPAKKKVTSRAPKRKLVAGRNAPPGRRPVPRHTYGGGISFISVLLTLVALGMLAVVVLIILPKDMSTVAGYGTPLTSGEAPRNLLAEAQKVMVDRSSEISFTEEEVNRYLNHRMRGSQTGPLASIVKFRGVYVDFTPGGAEIIIEREIFGQPLTMSAKVKPEEFKRQILYKPNGWTLGRIELGERNVKPVIDLFLRLRTTMVEEYRTIQQIASVRFEENRIVLDARI